MATMPNLFDRLGKPQPTETNTTNSEPAQQILPAQKLPDWLQHWSKPSVRVRHVRIFGPRSLRNQKSAINSAEILVQGGWLGPSKLRRRDSLEWQIVRKPLIQPTVATVAIVAAK